MALTRYSKKHGKDVCKLARYLMEYESFILHRRCKLSLTAAILSVINASLEHLKNPEEMWEWDLGIEFSNVDYLQALNFFQNFFHRVRDVQVTWDFQHQGQPIDLSQFHNIHCLELRNVSYDLVVGLEAIQDRLQEFISYHCDIAVHDFLSINPGGMDSMCLWTSLQKLTVVKCHVKDLQGALQRIPSLKHLDLSYNCLSNASDIKFLTNLEYLNLSYNSLTTVPTINTHSCHTLKTLLIRNNRLENLQGIQYLLNLSELDLRYNCLIYRTMLEPLFNLQKLQSLWLDGNPLSHACDYRCCTAQVLNCNTLHTNFYLDGVRLSKKEIHKVQAKSRKSASSANYRSKAIVNAILDENIACGSSLGPSSGSGIQSESSICTVSSKPLKERSESKACRKTQKAEKRPREAIIIDKTGEKYLGKQNSQVNQEQYQLSRPPKDVKFYSVTYKPGVSEGLGRLIESNLEEKGIKIAARSSCTVGSLWHSKSSMMNEHGNDRVNEGVIYAYHATVGSGT